MTATQTELASAFGDSLGPLQTLLSANDIVQLLLETRSRLTTLIRDRSAIEDRTRRETGAATATNEVDRQIAATLTRGKYRNLDASLLAKVMAALLYVQRTSASARGGIVELSNKYVFEQAAHVASLPLDAVLKIANELMSRMRALT